MTEPIGKAKIRKISAADIPLLASFEIEISSISFGGDAILDEEFHQNKLRKAMKKNRSGMLVLEVDGEIAGWLWMDRLTNYATDEPYIDFKSFFIVEKYRGTSVVSDLMRAGLEHGKQKGVKKVVGKVHISNLPMRVIYKMHGFAPMFLTMEYVYHDPEG